MVKFKMSSNIAVGHKNFAKAVDFYARVIGLENRSKDPNLADFDAAPITLYVHKDAEVSGPVLEFFVEDLEQARDHLVENGCEVLRWRGKGQDCYIQDPFGVIFNLWEE